MSPDNSNENYAQNASANSSSDKISLSDKKILIAIIIFLLVVISALTFFFIASKRKNGNGSPPPSNNRQATASPTGKTTATPVDDINEDTGSGANSNSTPTPTPRHQFFLLTSTNSLDGYLGSDHSSDTTADIQIGRNATTYVRGFVSFDITAFPTGVTIDEAVLRLYQNSVIGIPYSLLGNLTVDHIDYGDSLEKSDFNPSRFYINCGDISTDKSIGWKELVVTDYVKDDILKNKIHSQFRLRFSSESLGHEVWVSFESGDNFLNTTNLPQLSIKYR